jgi:O-antigen/teichoic acid export membrane protein
VGFFNTFQKYSKGRKGDVLGGFSFQMLSTSVVFVKQIALVPLFLTVLPLSEYAGWLVLQGVLNMFLVFNPGFADYYRQQIAGGHGRKDSQAIIRMVIELRRFQLSLALAISIAAFVAAHFDFFAFVGIDMSGASMHWAVVFALYSLVVSILRESLSIVSIGLGRATQVSMHGVISEIIGIAVTLASYKAFGVAALAMGSLVSSISRYAIDWCLYAKLMKSYADVAVQDISISLRFSRELWMTFAGRIARIFLLSSDLVLIAKFFSDETVVNYGLLKKLLFFAGSFLDRISNLLIAPVSSYFSSDTSHDQKVKMAKMLSYFGWSSSFVLCIFGALVSPIVIQLWIGEEYVMPLSNVAALSLFIAATGLVKWELLLRFSRGQFSQFAVFFVVFAVLVTLARLFASLVQIESLFYFSQASIAVGMLLVVLFTWRSSIAHGVGVSR